MKKQDDLSLGGSIILTIVFAIMAFFTYQTDSLSNFLAWIPGICVIFGIIMIIIAAIDSSYKSARKKQQTNFARSITYDSCFGNGDLKLYFNYSNKKVTICATTTSGTEEMVIDDFEQRNSIETDNHIVSLDSLSNKVIRVKNDNGSIALGYCCINDELKKKEVVVKPSIPTIKAFNDYAFITDDINEFVAVVTPSRIHVLRYSDIVSISYEENGSDVFNKSLGGAVVGGLLFGGVGAIVGGNTAKAMQNKEVKNMSIKILLKSTSDSTIILKIYEGGKDGPVLITKDDASRKHYENLMEEVSGIKDIFSIIIDIADKKNTMPKSAPITPFISSASVADELTKLVKLKEAGILSEEEFQAQKSKLLGM